MIDPKTGGTDSAGDCVACPPTLVEADAPGREPWPDWLKIACGVGFVFGVGLLVSVVVNRGV